MKITRCLAVVVFSACVAPAAAADLILSGSTLVWDPEQTPSPQFIVSVSNPAESDDLLFAWQLGIQIVPASGAVGQLHFQSAGLPASYLLDGRSDGLAPAFTGPSDSISVIADSDSLFSGVIVPQAGANLLALDFVASSGARGLFEIAIVPDPFQGASWFSSDFDAREYANVPFAGGGVVIGSVTLVPEPGGLTLILTGLALFFALSQHRRRGILPLRAIP